MKLHLKQIIRLLDNIFPPQCASCHCLVSAPHTLCLKCWQGIEFITEPCCRVCGYPLEQDTVYCSDICRTKKLFLTKIKSAVIYNDVAASVIHHLKYQDKTENAIILSNWMYAAGHDMAQQTDLIIPVPLHKAKLLKRKYNQAAIIAKRFAQQAHKPCVFDILTRRKDIMSQSRLSQHERIKNVKGAFYVVNREKIRNKTILLIDDVVTTAATINECAKVLLLGGATKVMSLTVARAKTRGTADFGHHTGLY